MRSQYHRPDGPVHIGSWRARDHHMDYRTHVMRVVKLPDRQRGNALIFTLLALVLTALGIAGYTSSKQIEMRTQAGQTEATVLEMLRNAANNAISDNVANIQQGLPMVKDVNGTLLSVAGVDQPGGEKDMVSHPNRAELYGLFACWLEHDHVKFERRHSTLISLRRTPAGCVVLNCNIEGAVVLAEPINDPITRRSDGVVIGALLTKLGADSAVSLPLGPPRDPSVLIGYGPGATWTMPNP